MKKFWFCEKKTNNIDDKPLRIRMRFGFLPFFSFLSDKLSFFFVLDRTNQDVTTAGRKTPLIEIFIHFFPVLF